MQKTIFTREEFLAKTEVAEEQLADWEAKKLVKAVGFTDDRSPFYSESAVRQVKQIKSLLELGYPPEDIQKIIRKVGLPKQTAAGETALPKSFLTVGDLAERASVSPRTVKHWESLGIIEPDMRSEGGFRLYSEQWVDLCLLVKDLQLFGYSLEEIKNLADSFREFLALQSNLAFFSKAETAQKLTAKQAELDNLLKRIDELKEGVRRWEELLRKKKKELLALINLNQKRPEGAAHEPSADA